jgi:nickel/cobalt exporter
MFFYILSSFWAGAVHAATPGHGKTIAAAYIVGARGKPIDALILGVFVTLSHTSGIVLVGVLASFGSSWLHPQRIEAGLALAMGLLVVALGLWMLWNQRDYLALAMGEPSMAAKLHSPQSPHEHPGGEIVDHVHGDAEGAGWHSHGWRGAHSHRLDEVSDRRPKLAALLALGIVGGLLPDPTALALLLAALSSGKVLFGLVTVLVFSFGFATTLVLVGVAAAMAGQKVLVWLSSIWAVRLQIATTLLILGIGVVLTIKAASNVAAMPS